MGENALTCRKNQYKMTSKERQKRRFSEEFRRKQVKLIDAGELTIADVSRLYDVRWSSVKRWVEKYGDSSNQGVLIVSRDQINRIKDLESKNAHLEKLLGRQQVKLAYLQECLSLAKEELGNDFEKKIARYY